MNERLAKHCCLTHFPAHPLPNPLSSPNSARAQQLFDWGLVWRYMFNDNEAACAFRAAQRNDPTCAMAFVGAALSMGPNVNYAVIVSSGVFHDILESLDGGRSALASGVKQMPLAAALYGAMLQRYVVMCSVCLPQQLSDPSALEFIPRFGAGTVWTHLASWTGGSLCLKMKRSSCTITRATSARRRTGESEKDGSS